MPFTAENTENEIRRVPAQAQERLLHVAMKELDGPPDPDLKRPWLEEAQSRGRELEAASSFCEGRRSGFGEELADEVENA